MILCHTNLLHSRQTKKSFQNLLLVNDDYKILFVILRHIECLTYLGRVKWLVDRKTEIIYKKYQFKLKLNKDAIDYAQRLHEELMKKNPVNHESPDMIAAICIFTVTLIDEHQKTLKEISEVSHIKEDHLRQACKMAFEEIKVSLNTL